MATNKKDWKEVFDVYPKAKVIYVCSGQPFLTEKPAKKYATETKGKVEVVKRPTAKKKTTVPHKGDNSGVSKGLNVKTE